MATENPIPPQRTWADFQLRFPPFPQAPEGVEIVPFKDYKEVGILKETPDRVERDALQVPTVAIKPHSTDWCKTNAQSGGRDAEEFHSSTVGGIREWWNDWEDMERRVQPGGYDERRSPQDRLHQAASDFIRARRPIPPKVNEIWDQIQLHLLQSTQVSHETESDPHRRSNEDEEDDVSGANDDEKLNFFENPAKSITIFLSYYIINQGFHFEDYKLINFPRVLGFFVKYLIVNNVWPECKASLDRSQSIINVASQELICTSKISKALPDDLNYAFRDHWNINPDVFYGDPVPNDDTDTETPEAKYRKDDPEAAAEFEQSLKDANLDLIKPEDMEEAIVAEERGEGGSENERNVDDGAAPAPQSHGDDFIEQDWSRPGLMALLGPTALPVTHTTGIVEQSMRRIVDIIPPPRDAPALPHAKDPSPEAIEVGLERRFTKVVLSPWLGSKTGSNEPTISSLSKGPVLGKDDIENDAPPSGPKPHNPWKDNITIFVSENAAKEFRVGMGLGGSWIQMARQQDFEIQDDKKKTKKKKGKKSDDRFWYMCSLMTVLTSYHLALSDVEGHVPDL
ncbi:hypothetical protein ARMGADRAFT_1012092 [Armillaria gallica]|uniref:Uncharacterized protein n=1 Tax=Armillaria gallica TaxID=47427 RepID=A0A2H3DFC3_ARMGA|nr:hypothetical protein ARMGADRAFT_1012092 [Armillaria gallica]